MTIDLKSGRIMYSPYIFSNYNDNIFDVTYCCSFDKWELYCVLLTRKQRDFLIHDSFHYLFTPSSTALIEKLTISQLVKKFPSFYGNRRFNTAFTRARHLSLY
jgi:hypothetical protein